MPLFSIAMDVKLCTLTPFLAQVAFTISFFLTQSHGDEASTYWLCNSTYNCGTIRNIAYPFWGEGRPRFCGSRDEFELRCLNNETTSVKVGDQNIIVNSIDPIYHSMKLVLADLSASCPWRFTNTSLDPSLFRYDNSTVENLTILYDCPDSVSSPNNITCPGNAVAFFATEDKPPPEPMLLECVFHVQVPVQRGTLDNEHEDGLNKTLSYGLVVHYIADWYQCSACNWSGGMCGTGTGINDTSQFSCHCQNGIYDSRCATIATIKKSPWNWKRRLIVGFTGGAIGAILICIAVCCFRHKSSILGRKVWKMIKNDQDIEAFLRNHGALALARYKFSDVKKMTNSFKVKLGQGGYGTVYKGKLLTDCPVAVKILDATKGNGEEFVNEVASISRTSHVNVVSLLGFCLEGNKRALVYEFMPNGSLEKFIYNKDGVTSPIIGWKSLHQIALGVARGLEYLHKGCNTRILHFDIKPHNILLDENFCPKISDFGLAKLCLNKESIISMSNARGTIGFVAPEVWNRSFGGVSHKSDVYSYGMLLLEMVGGRNNINTEVSCTSEIYFPYWVHKNLEMESNLGLEGVMTAEENEIAKKMVLVGLWCIQTIPNDRPTMSRVVQMLEGNINPLQIPPKPVLCSPPRSAMESSTA